MEEKYEKYLNAFNESAKHHFDNAPDNSGKKVVVEALAAALHLLTYNVNKILNQGCPNGQDECADGSCVPAGSSCRTFK